MSKLNLFFFKREEHVRLICVLMMKREHIFCPDGSKYEAMGVNLVNISLTFYNCLVLLHRALKYVVICLKSDFLWVNAVVLKEVRGICLWFSH